MADVSKVKFKHQATTGFYTPGARRATGMLAV